MASPNALRRALIALFADTTASSKRAAARHKQKLSGQLTPGTKPIGKTSTINELTGEVEHLGPGPEPFPGLTINETMGIAEPRYNPHQRALMEESAAKRLIDPESQRTSVFDESPDRSIQLEREIMEEVTGPRSRVQRQPRTTMEEMDNFFGEFEAKQIGEIQDELDTDVVLRTLSPELQKQVTRDILIPRSNRLKEIDEAALDLLGGPNKAGMIPEIQAALTGKDISRKQGFTIKTTPPKLSKTELQQVGQSSTQLHEFRKLTAQVLEAAREANSIKPNMDKIVATIKRMPPKIREQLRPAFKDDTIDEALADLVQKLVKRMEQ